MNGAAILVYHLVAQVERDPFGTAVSPENFAAHMEIVARRFRPQGLGTVAQALQHGPALDGAVAVTFDDGYANNLTVALPILEAWSVPATVFVATGYTGTGLEFWWDELEHLVACAPERALALRAGGRSLSFDASRPDAVLTEVWELLHRLERQQIADAIDQLRRWAGMSAPRPPRETHRPMTVEELETISASGVVELGAHTRWHVSLAACDLRTQREELEGSRADLETWLGRRPTSLAYPYGRPGHDYSQSTVQVAAQLGFAQALSTRAALAVPSASRHELPRFFVPDWEPDQFERWLDARFKSRPVRAVRKLARRFSMRVRTESGGRQPKTSG